MNKDIRVSVTLPTHPKTIKLMRRLGDRAFYCLIRLWTFVGQNKPDGILNNMDSEDIEIAADWQGSPGEFVETLIDIKFLDFENETYKIHDWEDHNEYAAHAQARSEKAKKAARARWKQNGLNKADTQDNATSTDKHMLKNASSNATSINELCPSPSPIPSPSPNNNLSTSYEVDRRPSDASAPASDENQPEFSSGLEAETDVSAQSSDIPKAKLKIKKRNSIPDCPHEQIVDLYHQLLPELPRVQAWGKTSQANLRARWREENARQNLAWWRNFFIWLKESDFLMGRKKDFQATLSWIVRPTNFEKILNGQYHVRGQPKQDPNAQAVAEFLAEEC